MSDTTKIVRNHRKVRTGEVISDKMNKTVVVLVKGRFQHPRYKKVVTRYHKLYAHDEKRQAKIGDYVRIQETRPVSKMKCWRLIEVTAKGSV